MKRETEKESWRSLDGASRALRVAVRIARESDPEAKAVQSALDWSRNRTRKFAAQRERFHAWREERLSA